MNLPPTISSRNVVTVSLCSSSQGRESLQKIEVQHALLLQRINYQSQAPQIHSKEIIALFLYDRYGHNFIFKTQLQFEEKKILHKYLYSSISLLQYISLEFIRSIHYFSNTSNSSHDSSIHSNHAHTKTGHTTALFSIHTHENICLIPTQSLHAELGFMQSNNHE